MPVSAAYRPAPRFPALGGAFFDAVEPACFPTSRIRYRNDRWAARIGLEDLDGQEWEQHFARFEPLPGNLDRPLALRYHGHQFMVYNPNLGDGRGFLFAQLIDARDGRLLDLGTKGSGQTPWSRGGDGRLTLKGGVREVLASEMLEALGVSTSKNLSLIETGESLHRGDEPAPTRSAVLVRLSHSHVRFGNFQRLSYLKDGASLRNLLDYCIENYMPELALSGNRPAAFLREVSRRSAALCASWMMAGFVHGVLNTDNMNVTGESFDYGPYRFLPALDPAFVAAYFDHGGLYAYGRQPLIVRWNLERLADALRPLATEASLSEALDGYEHDLDLALQAGFLSRLGLRALGPESDARLLAVASEFLEESGAGFEQFFFDWRGGMGAERRAMNGPAGARYAGGPFASFRRALETYEPEARAVRAHPYFEGVRPCALLVDEVEKIWEAIADRDDWSLFDAKIARIGEMRDAYGGQT
ncbi:MAG: YdiU family protein [Deltaproteobacteria bacterium]|nr:YdiU family protein [Deltaproteobacteria bacterium]